jgi:DNA-binding transcriptional LysR family regulator
MTQPTITFQIKSLEEAFGVKLFDRDRQQVRLTDAGYAFREYAQTSWTRWTPHRIASVACIRGCVYM